MEMVVSSIYDLNIDRDADAEKRATRQEAHRRAFREIERQNKREQQRRRAARLESYPFALFDPPSGKWVAGVMHLIEANRFKRKLSLPVFKSAEEATDAAERLLIELQRRG